MDIVYQLTFFLALGLLAIVVAIFVFAVSQIGRATESASREQEEVLSRQKEAKEKQIERIQERLEEARKVGSLDEKKLLAELQESTEEIKGYDTELRPIIATDVLRHPRRQEQPLQSLYYRRGRY